MKHIFSLAIVAFLFVSCGGGKKNEQIANKARVIQQQEKQLNISILLDLSDRISPEINPTAPSNDISNIETITEFFKVNMEKLGAYNAKGKIRVFFIPPPENSDINSIVTNLNIDCSKMDNRARKSVYDSLTELYAKNLKKIYNETIKTSSWLGSDIWRFFKDDVKDYCIQRDSSYRNILVILTDGYIYHTDSYYNAGKRYTYLLSDNLKFYRKQNWKELIIKDDFGIMTERDDLSGLEVLVLEVKAESSNNKIDEDILSFVLKKWFNEMNVSRCEVYHFDLPANTKTRIINFLNY